MPLDVLQADLMGVVRNGIDCAPARCIDADARELKFEMIMKVLQRDDPLRRSYLQRRWQEYPTSPSLVREVGRYKFERISLSPIALTRR